MSRVIAGWQAELRSIQRGGTEYQQLTTGLFTTRMPGMPGYPNHQKQTAVGRNLHVVRGDGQGNRADHACIEVYLAYGGRPLVRGVDAASWVCQGKAQVCP
ncbi:hypothetical protein D9M70_487110 [compost metagenome]